MEQLFAGWRGELAACRKFATAARNYAAARLAADVGLRVSEARRLAGVAIFPLMRDWSWRPPRSTCTCSAAACDRSAWIRFSDDLQAEPGLKVVLDGRTGEDPVPLSEVRERVRPRRHSSATRSGTPV